MTSVHLMAASNFELVRAWLAPIMAHTLAGASSRWPPLDLAGAVCRTRAGGWATLAPGEEADLLLHLRRPDTAADSSFETVEIAYQVADDDFTDRSTQRFLMRGPC